MADGACSAPPEREENDGDNLASSVGGFGGISNNNDTDCAANSSSTSASVGRPVPAQHRGDVDSKRAPPASGESASFIFFAPAARASTSTFVDLAAEAARARKARASCFVDFGELAPPASPRQPVPWGAREPELDPDWETESDPDSASEDGSRAGSARGPGPVGLVAGPQHGQARSWFWG